MKSLMILASAAFAMGLTSCSMAEGLVKTASRAASSVTRSVGAVGNSL
ncbi:MAG TPA: hypothetical protein VM511_01900 [Luteolibacter sp.]|nr:hypothetical protein [Luteolibacter sp.]